MLKEVLKFNRLASKDELLFLLFNALPLSKIQKISDLKKYCISNHFSIGNSFDGTVKVLEFMRFINISDDIVSINFEYFNPAEVKNKELFIEQSDFIEYLLLALTRENAIAEFIKPDAVKQDVGKGLFYVKDNMIPFRFFGIRNFLISLGFFQRDSTTHPSNLFISEDGNSVFKKFVVDYLRNNNEGLKRKHLSLEELKNRLDRQDELGKEAELYVLKYEQNRLRGHPFNDDIKRISDNYSNAGFDIESFNGMESIFVDRFIEVKSFSNYLSFYWSENEIQIAKELSERYYLYLIDRSQNSNPDYHPRMIQNPYLKIFLNDYWKKESETWKISPII